jgi:hypothetical protein
VEAEAETHLEAWHPMLQGRPSLKAPQVIAHLQLYNDAHVALQTGICHIRYAHFALRLPDEEKCVANVFVRRAMAVFGAHVHVPGDAIDELYNVGSQNLCAVCKVSNVAEAEDCMH